MTEFTGETYYPLLKAIWCMTRNTRKRRLLLGFLAAYKNGWWVMPESTIPRGVRNSILRLREDGWPIERTTIWRLQTWYPVHHFDLNRGEKARLRKHAIKHDPPVFGKPVFVWRIEPEFLEGFRLWFYGARQSRLIYMMNRKAYFSNKVKMLLKQLDLWQYGVIATQPLRARHEDRKTTAGNSDPGCVEPPKDDPGSAGGAGIFH